MWSFVIQLGLALVTSAISYAMSPKPEDTTQPNKMGRPTAQDGMVIPVVFGPFLIKDCAVLAIGDDTTHAIIANGGK